MNLLDDPFWTSILDGLQPPEARWATPGDMAAHIDPRTRRTPALDLIDQALVDMFNSVDGRLIISMPPQEGKSTRVSKDFPIWALTQNPDMRIVTASYAQGLANRNGRAIRNTILTNPDLGLHIAQDHGAVSEWSLTGHVGGVRSVGRGAGITGFPADLLIIDDPLKDRQEADSLTIRDNCMDWWTDSLSTRLAPGAPVVLILTRWHDDDLAGRLLDAPDGHLWRVINIPAQADTDDDPLGRQHGEFMQSARGRTPEQWQAIRTRVGSRTWAALYQGRPAPAEGGLLKREWWQHYDQPMHYVREDGTCWTYDNDVELLQSWDMAFKGTDNSDYVCGQVWLRRGANAYLLDQVHGRYDFVETLNQFRRMSAKWPQAVLKIVEDKANGPAVITSLSREIHGIVPEQPQGSKEARVAAISPLVEAGNVWLPTPELAPWVGDLIEETAAFPNGAHDDQCDALSQGLHRLILKPLLASAQTYEADDLFDLDSYQIGTY